MSSYSFVFFIFFFPLNFWVSEIWTNVVILTIIKGVSVILNENFFQFPKSNKNERVDPPIKFLAFLFYCPSKKKIEGKILRMKDAEADSELILHVWLAHSGVTGTITFHYKNNKVQLGQKKRQHFVCLHLYSKKLD